MLKPFLTALMIVTMVFGSGCDLKKYFSPKKQEYVSVVSKQELSDLITKVFEPKAGEKVLLLNDYPASQKQVDEEYKSRKKMAEDWHQAFTELSFGKNFSVEGIIYYEPTGANGKPLPKYASQNNQQISLEEKLDSLDEKNIVVAINKYSATAPLGLRAEKQKFRVASMPGASMEMKSFKADYSLVAKKAGKLAELLTKAEMAYVTFDKIKEVWHDKSFGVKGGIRPTKMQFDLRRREAEADDGNCREPGKVINLPSGEAYIAPYEGGDQELGESRTKGVIPVLYREELVLYEVRQNRIIGTISVPGRPKGEMSLKMEEFFKEDPARANIAELGLGVNEKAELMGNILNDEKIEGLHWAYGMNAHFMGGQIGPEDFKKPENALHEDIVYAKDSKIKIKSLELEFPDGTRKKIMEGGKYLPEVFE